MMADMDMRELIADDDFVDRVARATGTSGYASVSDYPDVTDLRVADADAAQARRVQLREELIRAFDGYSPRHAASEEVSKDRG